VGSGAPDNILDCYEDLMTGPSLELVSDVKNFWAQIRDEFIFSISPKHMHKKRFPILSGD